MIFEGKIIIDKTSKKPSGRVVSKAFDKVDSFSAATHLKVKGANEFIEITDKLIIKRIRRDSSGNPSEDFVHYSEINARDEFVCVINGKDVAISPDFYTQIAFMNKSETGKYLRCDDGLYVHKDEISIPAYKKLHLGANATLEKPVHDGDFYVQTEIVRLPNGVEITLPNNRVKNEHGKWLYQDDEGKWVPCLYKRDLDTRRYIKHVLLDGKKIVDIQKLQEKPNGELVVKGVDGDDVVVGKKDVVLQQPFVMGSTMEATEEVFIPSNIIKQRDRIQQANVNLVFTWPTPLQNGLKRVTVNRTRTKAVMEFADGHREIYAQYDVLINKLEPNDKVYYVRKFNIVDLGERGVKLEFLQMKNNFAQDVVFKNGKLDSCTLNDRKITDIKWHEVGGYDEISSYTIDGVKITDIEWHANQVKSCKLHLIDEDGNEVIKEIADLRSSGYEHLAITRTIINKIEDVKTNGSTFSFKMGDYHFVDAELTEDGNVGKCKLRHNGKVEEINLNEDERFAQLKLAVKISLDEQRVIPLVQSQLLSKKDGEYRLEADVVQTEKTDENGVAAATELQSVSQAIKEQEKFKQNPFQTYIIDSQNKPHTISDFETTYEGALEFEQNKEFLIDLIGKNKIEYKKGELKIDSKKTDNIVDNMIVLGFALCSNPITLAFAIPTLIAGCAIGVVAPIARAVKKSRLSKLKVEDFKQEMQDVAAKRCQENIDSLVDKYRRELKAYKQMYSQEEFEQMSKALRERFRFEYHKEIGKLQVLGEGSIEATFDASKKGKLTRDNYLAFLEYERICTELREGKQPHPDFKNILKEFNETEFADKQAKLLEQIRIYQEYGGAEYKRKAHALQMKNIAILLDQENAERALRGEPGLSKEDYRKQLQRQYNESVAEWGGIEDKIEAFKQSIEYLSADRNTRKQLLEEKRKGLEGELTKVKVERVEFAERLDKHGNPLVGKYTQSAIAYMEYVDQLFAAGETKVSKKFDLEFYESLTDEEKEMYTTTTTLSEGTARCASRADNRRVEYDRARAAQVVQKIEEKQAELAEGVARLSEKSTIAKDATFEDVFIAQAEVAKKAQTYREAYARVGEVADQIPHKELDEDATKRIAQSTQAAQVTITKSEKQIQQEKQDREAAYRRDVEYWALEEFAKTHKTEFQQYRKGVMKSAKGSMVMKTLLRGFFDSMKVADKDNAESYNADLEAYEVKHHMEENVDAEVFCELHDEEFRKFVDECNSGRETTDQLDPNSEIARCYYYAHCRKENPLRIDNFKRYFDKRVKAKAAERIATGTLSKHEKNKGKEVVIIQQPTHEATTEQKKKQARKQAPRVVVPVTHTPTTPAFGL